MPRHPLNALTTLDRSHCQCSSFSRRPEGTRQMRLPFTITSIQQCHRRVRQVCFIGATPSSPLAACLKTSFSRSNPVTRGQATPIKSSVRCSPKDHKQQRPRATSFLPTSVPSFVSSRLGHPRYRKVRARTPWAKPKTPGSLQINLLFTMYAEQASNPSGRCKLLLLQRISSSHSAQTPSELVELSGIEPLTLCLQSRCSPS